MILEDLPPKGERPVCGTASRLLQEDLRVGRRVWVEQLTEILWGKVIQDFKSEYQDFVLDTGLNR